MAATAHGGHEGIAIASVDAPPILHLAEHVPDLVRLLYSALSQGIWIFF